MRFLCKNKCKFEDSSTEVGSGSNPGSCKFCFENLKKILMQNSIIFVLGTISALETLHGTNYQCIWLLQCAGNFQLKSSGNEISV